MGKIFSCDENRSARIDLSGKFKIQVTGSESNCRKVWTSYGIAMHLLSFLQPREVCQDQLLNRFFYDIAICRVQTRINVIRPQHFLTSFYH